MPSNGEQQTPVDTATQLEENRIKVAAILDLETSPDGEKFVLLIRDENGKITEGIPMAEEVEKLAVLLSTLETKHRAEGG